MREDFRQHVRGLKGYMGISLLGALLVTMATILPGAVRPSFRLALDTLIMAVSWVNPPDDGRGNYDSLRLRYLGILHDTTYVFRRPFPTAHTHRHLIPPAAYGAVGGSAVFEVFAELQVWRFGSFTRTLSASIGITLFDNPPPPATVTTFTASKRPP